MYDHRGQRDGLLGVHGHAGEGLANVATFRDGIGLGVGPFRVDVDQTHLDGAVGILKHPITLVAIVPQPLRLDSPVDVLLGLPHVGTTATESECLESHRFKRAVAGENHQIRP